MKIIINIGLNVGQSEPIDQLSKIDTIFKNGYRKRIKTGYWQGVRERTLILRSNTDNLRQLRKQLKQACTVLQQDAIAYYLPEHNTGSLVFNTGYQGVKYDFDKQYFNL